MKNCENTYGPGDLEDNPLKNGQHNQDGCVPDGMPVSVPECKKPWQFSLSGDSDIIEKFVAESLNIAASDGNVYKLLGVHEQHKLIDASGFGNPISGGNIGAYPSKNAFDLFDTTWKSLQRGLNDIMASAFIGYDFGVIKTNEKTRRRYSVEDAANYKHITALKIMQSSKANERVGKIRVERSLCGMRWKGVQIIDLPDDDCLNTFLLKDSVKSRFWRIRPLDFNGDDRDSWGVKALQLVDNHLATHESNIQDKIFLENRDRDYSMEALGVKIYFDFQETQTTLGRIGFDMGTSETIYASAAFSSVVNTLGRPFIIGDIVQIDALTQYSAELQPIEKYMEVIDTMWASEGFTPQWKPTLQRIILQPAVASRETQNIFGDLGMDREVDALGLLSGDNGNHPLYQDYTDVTDEIRAEGKVITPERGTDKSVFRKFDEEEVTKIAEQVEGLTKEQVREKLERFGQQSQSNFQASDGMPPNSEPYTEGDEFPEHPSNKAYHRLTYSSVDDDQPPRLYRYSGAKNKWLFIEADYRRINNSIQPILQEFINSPHGVSTSKATKK